ncbi:hypothetical protein BC834DRAFT_217492 [Gloeopeniophorella convolvens]|nr:hypothetical protein BC834DRAFT_217492 [Gloeopeniophorella convolvens]
MGIPGDIGISATENLRSYISQATLPLMILPRNGPPVPPSGHRSHNVGFTTRPETYRRLEFITQDPKVDLHLEVTKYINWIVPEHPLEEGDVDPKTCNAILIPCNPTFDIPQPRIPLPTNIDQFASWVHGLPLRTTERIMHLVYPDSKSWSFVCQTGDIDEPHFRYYAWELSPNVSSTSGRKATAVVMALPPWTMTPTDFKCFVACKEFPLFSKAGRARLNEDERIWGKLYDLCIARDSPYFVVTNYYNWVFGAFSKGWGGAIRGEILKHGNNEPTVLEHLLYWVASSMSHPGTYQRPEVPETHVNRGLMQPTSSGRLPTIHDIVSDDFDNESTWGGNDDDLQSGYSFSGASNASYADSGRVTTYRPAKDRQERDARNWLRACQEAGAGEPSVQVNLNDDSLTSVGSKWSSFSAATVRAGNWINPSPTIFRQS